MFAPKGAKPQAKVCERSRRRLASESASLPTRPFSGSAIEQALFLQRTIGNQATLRLLARQTSNSAGSSLTGGHEQKVTTETMTAEEQPPRTSWDFSKVPLFPDKRADRAQPLSLRSAQLGVMQPKLAIGDVNDPLEHEADRVADQVMRMPAPEIKPAAAPPQISRKCAACEADEQLLRKRSDVAKLAAAEAPSLVHEVLRSPGQPLDVATRTYFEPRFQQDFSRVRVHADSQATASAQAVQARAYTVGPNIVFGTGQYAPATQTGQRLLAHELTHVVQQERGVALSPSSDGDGSTGAAAPTFSRPAQGAIAQLTIQRAPLCPGTRDSGEVTKSRSPTGVLAVDTSFDGAKESLSVYDFGIDQDSVPPSMTQSDDWRRMMSMILGDPTTHVAVLGYSDCIGAEQNNQGLRDRRANAAVKAMPAEAQAKVWPAFKGWWGSLTYLFPNDTAENRARNRMVLIALMRSLTEFLRRLAQSDQYRSVHISGQLPGKAPGPDQGCGRAKDPVRASAIVFRERHVEHGAQSQ